MEKPEDMERLKHKERKEMCVESISWTFSLKEIYNTLKKYIRYDDKTWKDIFMQIPTCAVCMSSTALITRPQLWPAQYI